MTQEVFAAKVQESRVKMADIFGRIHTPKAKGYRKIQIEAGQELAAILDSKERTNQ
jgi:hypothetical protein